MSIKERLKGYAKKGYEKTGEYAKKGYEQASTQYTKAKYSAKSKIATRKAEKAIEKQIYKDEYSQARTEALRKKAQEKGRESVKPITQRFSLGKSSGDKVTKILNAFAMPQQPRRSTPTRTNTGFSVWGSPQRQAPPVRKKRRTRRKTRRKTTKKKVSRRPKRRVEYFY